MRDVISYIVMKDAFSRIKSFLFDLLFPVECAGCGATGTYLCTGCFAAIPLAESFTCPACGKPSFENAVCASCKKMTALTGLIAAASYDMKIVRRMIIALKYRFVKELAVPLARLLLKALARHNYALFYRKDLVMIPVPLSTRRERWRGFNQAREIAALLSQSLNIPLEEHALRRARSIMPQTETSSREERFENIRGAFALADASRTEGKVAVLVDDVATTLATLSECARVLQKGGAKEVWGMVVAREYASLAHNASDKISFLRNRSTKRKTHARLRHLPRYLFSIPFFFIVILVHRIAASVRSGFCNAEHLAGLSSLARPYNAF